MTSKRVLLFLGLITVLVSTLYLAFKIYVPNAIANAITSAELPVYLPEQIKLKVKKIKGPVNEGASTIIKTLHTSNVTLTQVLQAIDNTTEEQAYALLDSLNEKQPENIDQFFDMVKYHFPVEFDVEVFRKPYHEKINMRLIKKGIAYANHYKKSEEIDFETARSIMKQILIQKEQEFDSLMGI